MNKYLATATSLPNTTTEVKAPTYALAMAKAALNLGVTSHSVIILEVTQCH